MEHPVICPRCHTEIKTLVTVPHGDYECLSALTVKVGQQECVIREWEEKWKDLVESINRHNSMFPVDTKMSVIKWPLEW
jgi:hypothetical protein